MRQITKMLSLGSIIAYLLGGCGQGNGSTTPNADNPSSPPLSLTISVPAEYPAGTAVNMPVVVTNNNPYTLTNINYTIVDDNATSGQITIDPTSATNCKTIAANQECTLSVVIPATSKPGAFSIKASLTVADNATQKQSLLSSILQSTTASTTITTTGLTQLTVNNESGINGVVMYYQPYITLPNNSSGIALVTFVVNSANVGVFNTIDLVDSNGNSLQYQVLTSNSGNGMTVLSQGSVVTLAVSIPSGATQLSLFPSLKNNGTPIANGLASSPTTINVLRPDAPAQGILNVVPSNFILNESNTTQIITLINSGNGVASGLNSSVSAPMQIDSGLSTCGTTLESNAVCTYVVKFDGQSDKAGTSAFTLNYNTGTQPSSNTATFTYRGAKAVASLNISSGTNPNFNFSTTTANSSESSIITMTNSGVTNLTDLSYTLPSGFTTSTVGISNPCTTSLSVGATCNIALIYNNSTVTPNTTADVIVKYKYQDPVTELINDGSSTIGVSYETIQSQASLSVSSSILNFNNIYNNNTESVLESITITNSGAVATSGVPTISFASAAGIYSIASNTCTAALNSGDKCVVTIKSGPIPSSQSSGNLTNTLNISYIPYLNATANNATVALTTQVVTAQTAVISVSQTSSSGFVSGNGESSGTPFIIESGASGSLTYTITNSGAVPATNFVITSDAGVLSPWAQQSTTCGSTLVANANCSVTYSLSNPTIGVNNLPLNTVTLSWVDQDSPGGESKPFATQAVYTNVSTPPQITFTSNTISVVPSGSTNIIATLSGGYNVGNQTVAINTSSLPNQITISSVPTPCVLNSQSPNCTFRVSASADATNLMGQSYTLPVTNTSGNASVPSSIVVQVVVGWIWMGGESIINQAGVYGTKGVSSESNVPAARAGSISWTDWSGNMWLFGGDIDGSNNSLFNDLWRYNPNINQWTWISGSNLLNQSGNYGAQGLTSPTNIPGARVQSISWIDESGNLWLFGGIGRDGSNLFNGYLNDLWRYNPNTNQWTWMNGESTYNGKSVYGTKGVSSSNNVPGARNGVVKWTDESGNLWLFGGYGYSSNLFTGYLNDLWRYNPNTNQWTWMSGESTNNSYAVYGTKGLPSSSNIPGARYNSVSWTDGGGNMWLFSGQGFNGNGDSGKLNDLWRYNPNTNEWTWVSGSDSVNQLGVYGSLGVESSSNIPGARSSSISWIDKSGKFWIFGGSGFASSGVNGTLNDLWRYDPSNNQWTWMNGAPLRNQAGTYNAKGQANTNSMPGSRGYSISWIDNGGNLWLFGGYGVANGYGVLNDLWMYTTPY